MNKRVPVLALSAATAVTAVLVSTGPGAAAPSSAMHSGARLGAVLVGGNEVTPGDPEGYGFASVRVSGAEVCWRITVNGDVADIAAAHIHAGPRGVAGPVVVPLEPYTRGCADVPHRTARFISEHPDQFYVNVHNAEFPAGALRGQLLD